MYRNMGIETFNMWSNWFNQKINLKSSQSRDPKKAKRPIPANFGLLRTESDPLGDIKMRVT